MAERRAELGINGEVIPDSWERMIAACLARAPAFRPQTGDDIVRQLAAKPSDGLPPQRDPFDWCYAFTNRDEKALRGNAGGKLPPILADLLSQKTVAAIGGAKALKVLQQAESGGEAAGTRLVSPGPGQGFFVFGIKWLRVPDPEIRKCLTCHFARQAALQLRFSHWDGDGGFKREPRRFDCGEQVKQTLERWRLTDDHLQLSRGILPEEAMWKPITQDWMDVMPRLATLTEHSSQEAGWIDALERLAAQRYEETFRGLGTRLFYQKKAASRRERARFISDQIERHLFAEWQDCTNSMDDAKRVLEALRAVLDERLRNLDAEVAKHKEDEERANGLVQGNRSKYARIGMIGSVLRQRKPVLNKHAEYLCDMYIHRTLYVWPAASTRRHCRDRPIEFGRAEFRHLTQRGGR